MNMETKRPFGWRMRKRFWDRIATIKFSGNKPAKIPLPPEREREIKAIPLNQVFPSIPIPNILVADHVPADEKSVSKKLFYKVQTRLYSTYPPMQSGLPPIDSDPQVALREAYTRRHRKLFPAPVLPDVYAGDDAPELGILAVASPYACYLERAAGGEFCWDLRSLSQYDQHDGLYSLGVRVAFTIDKAHHALRASRIESELGSHAPGDPEWPVARSIALCALSTHLSLVRHFNWVHLAAGGSLAIATRNRLPAGHPLCRLIWPHMYGTQYSNDLVTAGQMFPGGEFDTVFGFTHGGMCKLFADTYDAYRISVIDPERDWEARGLAGSNFDAPVQRNLQDLFDVMHRHATRYVNAYFPDDKAIKDDRSVQDWLAELDRLIPNGIDGVLEGSTGRAGVARLIAAFIYMASVQHEAMGTALWNYQLWVHKHPVRVRTDGQREPLDIYQRLVNANFNLNVSRAQLMADYSYLALDDKGADLFRLFERELEALETKMNAEKAATWKILPTALEANINA